MFSIPDTRSRSVVESFYVVPSAQVVRKRQWRASMGLAPSPGPSARCFACCTTLSFLFSCGPCRGQRLLTLGGARGCEPARSSASSRAPKRVSTFAEKDPRHFCDGSNESGLNRQCSPIREEGRLMLSSDAQMCCVFGGCERLIFPRAPDWVLWFGALSGIRYFVGFAGRPCFPVPLFFFLIWSFQRPFPLGRERVCQALGGGGVFVFVALRWASE